MGRTYVAEAAVQQHVDSLLSLHDSAVGLVVGQVTIVAKNRYGPNFIGCAEGDTGIPVSIAF